ncbi:zinc finger protein 2 homolog [Ixodes scapularis]
MSASCVVCDCTNHLSRKVTANLFRFPSKLMYPEKRAAWVAVVRKVHPDGSLWEPSPDSQICSAHFITGRPSNFKDRPDFVPTVFNYARAPGESAEQSQDPCVERHEDDCVIYRTITSPSDNAVPQADLEKISRWLNRKQERESFFKTNTREGTAHAQKPDSPEAKDLLMRTADSKATASA